MFAAAGPFCPCVTSKETFWPSFSDLKPEAWIALWCANRSFPPSSGVMNPKPLESLNHFTVPVGMSFHFLKLQRLCEAVRACIGHDDQRRESTATREPLVAAGRRVGHSLIEILRPQM